MSASALSDRLGIAIAQTFKLSKRGYKGGFERLGARIAGDRFKRTARTPRLSTYRRGRSPGSRVVTAVLSSQGRSLSDIEMDNGSPLTVAGAAPELLLSFWLVSSPDSHLRSDPRKKAEEPRRENDGMRTRFCQEGASTANWFLSARTISDRHERVYLAMRARRHG
jgi:hypothetical protein